MVAMLIGAVLDEVRDRLRPSPPRSDWQERYFAMLPGPRDVIFVGDSLTARGLWSEHFTGRRIANRGVEGDTTTRLLTRLDEIADRQPGTVVLMIGINDLSQRLPMAEIAARYEQILERLAATGARLVVQSVLQVGQGSRKAEPAAIRELNAWLAAAAARHGARFLDLDPVLAPEGHLDTRFTIDGTHLNGRGYLRWAEALAPYLS